MEFLIPSTCLENLPSFAVLNFYIPYLSNQESYLVTPKGGFVLHEDDIVNQISQNNKILQLCKTLNDKSTTKLNQTHQIIDAIRNKSEERRVADEFTSGCVVEVVVGRTFRSQCTRFQTFSVVFCSKENFQRRRRQTASLHTQGIWVDPESLWGSQWTLFLKVLRGDMEEGEEHKQKRHVHKCPHDEIQEWIGDPPTQRWCQSMELRLLICVLILKEIIACDRRYHQ